MGIYDKKITGSNGINYTKEVDGPSDWGGIAYNTFFKDLSDGLIYWRNPSGAVIHIYELGGSGGGAATGGTVTTNYATLTGLISTNSLVPGVWYQFPYSTKHLIGGTTAEYNDTSVHYDDGTAVKSTLVPETEILSALALSGSVIHVEVKSTQYPNDIIYYDVNDNLTEDGNQSRPGFITYRKDTVNNISAHYDWRNVIHRRFDIDTTDTGTARQTDFRTMVGYDSVSNVNHYEDYNMLPSFVNFSTANHTDIGPLNTHTTGTYRDFKTFVGMDEDIFTGSDTKGRYLNIHIDKSGSQARIVGSGNGVPDNNNITPNIYGGIANIVFFTKSSENITIGTNCSGVMIIGKTIKDIKIGNNNQNIIIGGSESRILYSGTKAKTINYSENITIGNNNRNISIDTVNRRTSIGNNNTGVMFQRRSFNNTIGNYNTLVYNSLSTNVKIGDWVNTVRLSNSHNIVIDSECQTVDLVLCGSEGAPGTSGSHFGSTNSTFPDGFGNNTITTLETSAAASVIGARATNLLIFNSAAIEIKSQVKNTIVNGCSDVKIGNKGESLSILFCYNIDIGVDVEHIEVAHIAGLKIDEQCSNIKYLGTGGGGSNNAGGSIGKYSSNILVVSASEGVKIGHSCSSVFLTGSSVKTNIGNNCTDVILRASSYNTIGNKNSHIFLAGSNNNIIGNNNTDISLADVGMVYKPGFPSFSTYTFYYDDALYGRTYAGRTHLALTPYMGNYVMSLGGRAGVGVEGSNYTKIGDNCSEIFIVRSDKCVIGNNTSNVDIGSKTDSGSTYTLGNVSGVMNSVDLAGNPGYNAISALTATFGLNCHENVLGSNNSNINIRGTAQSGNTFGDNVTSVEAVSGFTFVNNRVLVDGNSVTATTNYNGVNFDKNSADGNRWSVNINNSGIFSASTTTKLQ